jgi:hypothetical protein
MKVLICKIYEDNNKNRHHEMIFLTLTGDISKLISSHGYAVVMGK